MRIGVVGGLNRNARELEGLALAHGHQLETHTGVLSGPGSAGGLRALIARSDLVVILTEINSHNAVRMGRRLARVHNRPLRIMRRLGISQFAAFLRGLSSGEREKRACA